MVILLRRHLNILYCFRIIDNHIYLENYPRYSMPDFTYGVRATDAFSDMITTTENSTDYVPSPAIALEVQEDMYLLRLKITASSVCEWFM